MVNRPIFTRGVIHGEYNPPFSGSLVNIFTRLRRGMILLAELFFSSGELCATLDVVPLRGERLRFDGMRSG